MSQTGKIVTIAIIVAIEAWMVYTFVYQNPPRNLGQIFITVILTVVIPGILLYAVHIAGRLRLHKST